MNHFKLYVAYCVLSCALLGSSFSLASNEATELIAKSEMHIRGKSFQAEMQMVVENNSGTRALNMQIWTQGREKALVKVLKPTKDRNTGNLRIGLDLWQYLPNIERIVKIPPSMMLQSWMGSDFTNDDLVKSSSLERDYDHQIESKEMIQGEKAVKIRCLPKPTAPVVWGKVIAWVRAGDGVPLKQEYYSEDGELLKVMEGTQIKSFGSHTIPTHLLMMNLKKKDSRTTLIYDRVIYDETISDKVFTQENLRKAIH